MPKGAENTPGVSFPRYLASFTTVRPILKKFFAKQMKPVVRNICDITKLAKCEQFQLVNA